MPPFADAGPDLAIAANTTLQLDATASFAHDGSALTYQWKIIQEPNGPSATISDPTFPTATLDPRKNGVHLLQLTVSDGQRFSKPDSILLSSTNTRPVARAGSDVLMQPRIGSIGRFGLR